LANPVDLFSSKSGSARLESTSKTVERTAHRPPGLLSIPGRKATDAFVPGSASRLPETISPNNRTQAIFPAKTEYNRIYARLYCRRNRSPDDVRELIRRIYSVARFLAGMTASDVGELPLEGARAQNIDNNPMQSSWRLPEFETT
jgi:hypothetical protein